MESAKTAQNIATITPPKVCSRPIICAYWTTKLDALNEPVYGWICPLRGRICFGRQPPSFPFSQLKTAVLAICVDGAQSLTFTLFLKVVAIAIYVCFLAVMVDYVGVAMMRTLLPFYAVSMGGGATLVGALETAYGCGQVVGALALGRFSDAHGRRLVLLISFAGSAIGYTMAGLAVTPLFLLLSRIPVGLAKQTVAVSRAIVADCTNEGQRSGLMARLTSMMAIGYALGPVLGGALADSFGDTAPAFCAVVLFCALIPVAAFVLPETSPGCVGNLSVSPQNPVIQPVTPNKKKDQPRDSAPADDISVGDLAVSRQQARKLIAVLALSEFAVVAYSGTGLSTLVQSLGQSRSFLGLLNSTTATVAAISSGVVIPWIAGRHLLSDRALVTLGAVLFAGASTAAAVFHSAAALRWTVVPFGLALSILRSCPAALLSKVVSTKDDVAVQSVGSPQGPIKNENAASDNPAAEKQGMQGEAMGWLDAMSSACRIVAPTLAGILADRYGATTIFTVSAVMCLLAACILATTATKRVLRSSVESKTE